MRRSLLASDTIIMLVLTLLVNIWALLVSWPGLDTLAQTPSARVIAVPWIALIFFIFLDSYICNHLIQREIDARI